MPAEPAEYGLNSRGHGSGRPWPNSRRDPAAVAVSLAVTAGKLAGMDGNRTHPGRLSSAPQTVLKTAGKHPVASVQVPRRSVMRRTFRDRPLFARRCPVG